ncbi:hypothetical protein Tco_0249080, partial [Tanacetum coccineum]
MQVHGPCNEEGHYSNECLKKNQYPTKVKMCRTALLHGYEPIEDIYEDEKYVFCLKEEEIIITDNSSSSSDHQTKINHSQFSWEGENRQQTTNRV